MRAWKLDAVGEKVRTSEVADPVPRGGGAVITVLAAHVPAYTAALAEGLRGPVPTPLVLGPACVGRVESVADDVFDVGPGDVVVNTGLLSSGEEEIIVGWTGVGGDGVRTEKVDAMQKAWRDGVFAERAVCPKETLVKLPGAEDYERYDRLAFLPWLAIAAEAVNRAELRAGQSVVVLGATGQLGAAAVLLALAHGASRVVAVGRNKDALGRLSEMDSRVTPVELAGNRARDTAAIIDGDRPDVVLDVLGAVPSADPTLAGFDSLRPGGTMVLVGGVRQDLSLPYGMLMRRRLTLRGSWMATPETVLGVWRMVESGLVDLAAIDVRTVGLDDPAGALDLAAATGGPAFVALVPGLSH